MLLNPSHNSLFVIHNLLERFPISNKERMEMQPSSRSAVSLVSEAGECLPVASARPFNGVQRRFSPFRQHSGQEQGQRASKQRHSCGASAEEFLGTRCFPTLPARAGTQAGNPPSHQRKPGGAGGWSNWLWENYPGGSPMKEWSKSALVCTCFAAMTRN